MEYLIYLLLIILSLSFFAFRKRIKKSDFENIHVEREKNNSPKILYLRAFNVDKDDGGNSPVSFLKIFPKEMELANELINLDYHLIAVGKPEEDLPEIGFHRIKFSHEEWQKGVLDLMSESSMIIWRPDTTQGVFWELGKLFDLNYRNKLVIWAEMGYEDLKNVQEARYNSYKRKALKQLNENFPPFNLNKKFLVSKGKDQWEIMLSLKQTPIYKKISDSASTTKPRLT